MALSGETQRDVSRPTAPAALDLPTAQALLQQGPVAMALCDAFARVQWCNAAFLDAVAQTDSECCDQPLALLLGLCGADTLQLAQAVREGVDAASPDMPLRALDGSHHAWQVRVRGLPDGRRAISLWPTHDLQRAADRARRLGELLDMAQDFGRLGVWERDVRTLQGHWDRNVFRFWGLPESDGTPDQTAAMASILPEDREALDQAFHESLQRAGNYAHRYRVRTQDGSTRRLHSQWRVKDGADGRPERVIGVLVDDTEAWNLARSHGETAEHLRLALELGGIVVWRHDLRSEQVHFSGRAFEVLGLPQPTRAMSAAQLRELVHPDDQAALRQSVEQALGTGRPVDVETRFRHVDGSWRHLLTRRVLQHDAQGQPAALLGVGLDLSERVAAGKRHTELMRQFELTARAAGIGYWSVEADTKRSRWSAQTFALHGLPPQAEALSMRDWLRRFVDPADRAAVQRRYADWAKSGQQNLEQEFRILRCDGASRHVLSYSRLEGRPGHYDFFGVLMDVTERRAAEAALRRASERAALAIRGAGMGTWEQDLLTGEAIWDEQMWHLRGLEPRAKAMSVEERMSLVHPDDRERALRKLNEVTAEGKLSNLEFRVRWPDGQWRFIASRATTVRDEQGRLTRRIGVNWDVTDMRMAQTARHEREVAQRENLAKSQFLSRMSHELRTPLNAVLGFAQLLLSDGERVSAETRRRRLEQIHGAGQHLLSLIDDVLDLSRLEGGEMRMTPQPVALAALVAETLPLVARLARQRKVRLRSGMLDGVARADATRLRQVLLNLLTNAVKYNREGGQVLVETAAQGDRVLLRVSDTGRGMSETHLQQAFEPFNRLGLEREGIEGTGIGLAIVKALVERMDGTLEVRSTLGEGSVFEVSLIEASMPDDAPPTGATLPASSPRQPAHARTRPARLLYIEDNPVNLLIVQELLARRRDLQLHTAVDGLSGLRQAVQARPDLILVDMQLPDIDGREVLRRLRADAATAAIPCVAVSANAMPEDIRSALQAGFADYWTKPLDLDHFVRSLDTLLSTRAASVGGD